MRRQRQTIDLPEAVARRLEESEIQHLTQLASAATLTAGTGGFDSHLLGELDLFATNLDNAVLIPLEESSVVVTPDDPDAFLDAINRSADTP